MKSRSMLTVAAFAAAAIFLTGCDALTTLTDTWFTPAGRPSKLKGERIPVMSLDESMKHDAALAGTKVVLPPPYRNDD